MPVFDGGTTPFQDPVNIVGANAVRMPDQATLGRLREINREISIAILGIHLASKMLIRLLVVPQPMYILQGSAANDTINISGINAGTFNGIAFANIETLRGTGGDDTFTFGNGATISGTLDGGTGNNTLDYSAYITDVTINLDAGTAPGTGGISNVQSIIGGVVAILFKAPVGTIPSS